MNVSCPAGPPEPGGGYALRVVEALTRCSSRIVPSPTKFRELLRYGLSSAIALAIDYSLLIVLTDYLGLHYALSAAIGFTAGLVVIYVLSVAVVFEERRLSSSSLEFVGFATVGVFGLILNEIFLWSFVNLAGITYTLGKVPSAGIVFVFNFLARRTLLFSRKN